jgi:hypothetical protein
VNSLAIDRYSRPDNFQRVGYLLHHFFRRQVGSMQDDRQVSESHLFQALLDNVESGFLLSNKQDTASCGSQAGNQIGDGLALAGSGRTVDHPTLTSQNRCDRTLLA